MIRKYVVIICSALLVSCAGAELKERQPSDRFSVHIDANGIPFELARKIGLQYLSHVSWYDYDGKEITVAKCNEKQEQECQYKVSHIGNGCGWGSLVTEVCIEDSCQYSFSGYNEGGVICE